MRFDFDQVFPTSSKTKRRASSATDNSSATPIVIPELTDEIPTSYTLLDHRPNSQAWEYVLLAIAEVFTLDEHLVKLALSQKQEAAQIAPVALRNFIERRLAHINAYDLCIDINDGWSSPYTASSHEEEFICDRDGVCVDKAHLILSVSEGGGKQHRLLQPVLDSLTDSVERSLFYRAYRLVNWFQFRFLIATTPAICKLQAEQHYWNWEPGEHSYYQSQREYFEVGEMTELFAAIKNGDIYRHQDMVRSFDRLLFSPRGRAKLTPRVIDNTAAGAGSSTAIQLAKAIKNAECYIRSPNLINPPSLEDMDQEMIGSAVYLRWNALDDTVKISDDFSYDMMNAGYNTTQTFGVRAMQVSNLDEARQFIAYLESMFLELQVINELFSAISISHSYD